jgi:autotransporter-associated beta strand protein
MQGASLTIGGTSKLVGGSVQGGNAGAGGTDGQAFGSGMFLEGSGTLHFRPGLGQTEHVFRAIDDEAGVVDNGYAPPGGFTPGSYNLVKSGLGTLMLSADNAYSGGTILKAGTLDVAAPVAAGVGAAGFGSITFAGKATLEIDNRALIDLFGHIFFGTLINSFGKHAVLDLTGLHFHHGATATYNMATGALFVHSGKLTYGLGLRSPHGTHFHVASDGHGGTDVTLDPPLAATVASLTLHSFNEQHWTADSVGSTHHMGDYLIVG